MIDNGLSEFHLRLVLTAVWLYALFEIWRRIRKGQFKSAGSREVWFDRERNAEAFWMVAASLVAADLALIWITWTEKLT